MRVTAVSVEGNPEEIGQVSELVEMLKRIGTHANGNLVDAEEVHHATDDDSSTIDSVWSFIQLRGRSNPNAWATEDFVRGALEFPDSEYVLGTSQKSPDGLGPYLRLGHRNHLKGAFAYVTPASGKVGLRLPRDLANGQTHARPSGSKDPYQVAVWLDSEEALKECLELAYIAYERVAE